MEIQYVNVKEILGEKKIQYPNFDIFNERGNVIKIAYWQPKGEITFDKQEGFYCKEEEHLEKAKNFLNYSRNENSNIVITPEYSTPWKVLEDIISERELQPKNNKLWCLGMAGISCDSLQKFCDKYMKNETIRIFHEDWDNIAQNNFVSCIVYLFCSTGKLICIIQLKTTAASDRWAELEAYGLSTGNTIYYFQNQNGTNCLFSFICADALNQSISIIEKSIVYQKCIILHPQLNPKPLHDSFTTMRKSFLDYSKSNIRIVSVNWSKDSILKNEESGDIKVEDSYTACYYNEVEMQKVEKLLARNKQKGIDLAKDGHILIWHMPSNEHCMIFSIDGFDSRNLNNVTAMHNEPLGNIYLEYVDGKWTEQPVCAVCSVDWEWLKEVFEFEKCSSNKCDVWYLHKFFSILFGEKMYKDITLLDGEEVSVFSKKTKLKNRVLQSRERCKYIHEELKDGNVPAKFAELKKRKFRWILSEKGNLNIDTSCDEELISVVYVDSSEETLIKKAIIEFQNLMGEAAKDKMLLYYMTRKGIQYYDDLYNTEINNPNYTKSIETIN